MSLPKSIQNVGTSERRRSIARLTRSPMSSSPMMPNSPHRFDSRANSFTSNSPFLKHKLSSPVPDATEHDVFSRSDDDSSDSNPDLPRYVQRYLLPKDDQFKLEGADITRNIYKATQQQQSPQQQPMQRELPGAAPPFRRSRSFGLMEELHSHERRGSTASSLNVPGGFRREYLRHKSREFQTREPNFLTRNFIEFLTIYGHFAGEELEDEDDLIACHYKPMQAKVDEESSFLLSGPDTDRNPHGTATAGKAYFLLLKAFVGTGVLFLPKAFSNGGLVFLSFTMLFFGILSYWCYLILVNLKLATKVASFGEMGLKLYGKWLQQLIVSSIILSQIGFVGAYIVFTSENLRAFYSSVAGINLESIHIAWFIMVQLVVFLPLSLVRDITKLSFLALLANVFILVGLVTIVYFTSFELVVNRHGQIADSIDFYFNKSDFSLFIGVAIFAFEGIGLIIPIEQSMIYPKQFPRVLFKVILTISLIFIGIGSLGYLTFGSNVKTVILLNLPQNSPMIMVIQILYAFAILLLTPLQLFPAIRLLELKIFVKTGKTSLVVKWQKNCFRFAFVLFTAVVALVGGQNLDKFVLFVGCFACIPLVYMYPPILHLKSCCDYNQWGLLDAERRKRFWLANLDYALVAIGAVAVVYTTYDVLRG